MSLAEFELAVVRATSRAKNGHTNTSFDAGTCRMNAVPVRFTWFEDGMHVVRARENHADLLGTRVIEIEGNKPEAILAAKTLTFPQAICCLFLPALRMNL